MRIKDCVKLAVFVVLLVIPLRLYAETIWVSDRGAKHLVRLSPDGKREIIKFRSKNYMQKSRIIRMS